MKSNFSFNKDKNDYWEIYEVIQKYYPIGVDRGLGTGIYFQYPGINELEDIVVENIHNNDNFNERWVDFTKQIGLKMNKPIMGTSYGQAPSFSSSVILEPNEKEIRFSVSLIGKFYQIYGVDAANDGVKKRKSIYQGANVIIASPFEEFKEYFEIVEKMINKEFSDFRIVPYSIGQSIIKGLQVRYLDDENCSVNKALFNQFLSDENVSKDIRGDINYGDGVWTKTN